MSVYFCPTSGEIEDDVHGGFDTCCSRPDLHRDLLDLEPVRQHRMSPTCWCGPTLAPGTKFGVLMHRKPEES